MYCSLDPGLSGTGVAFWGKSFWCRFRENPTCCQNLYPKDSTDMISKTGSLLEQLRKLFLKKKVTEVWCEMPEFFDDAGGHMTAKKGDLLKLTFFVGAVAGLCYEMGIKFYCVTPAKWKGQTKKDMVIRKIQAILPTVEKKLNPKSHSWDAIGIGLWAQGFYRREAT